MRHQVRTVALNLLVRRDGAEDYFGKLTAFEGLVCDASNDFQRLFNNGDAEMGSVIDESRYVVLGHLGQLFLENALESSKDDV